MTDTIPIIISLISLVVSLATLYYNVLRPPVIKMIVSDTLGLLSFNSGFGLEIPITFINTSPTVGVITRSSIVLYRDGERNRARHILWYDFRLWNTQRATWSMETTAGALVIDAKSSITKRTYFQWTEDYEIPFERGDYFVIFCAWLENDEVPSIKLKQKFSITGSMAEKLLAHKAENRKTIVNVTLSQSFQQNEIMTEHRLDKFLKSK